MIPLNKPDLEHKLQKGSILYLDEIPTHKVTLGDMADYGFTKAQSIISLMCMDEDKAKEYLSDAEQSSTFLYIVLNLLQEYKALENGEIQSSTNLLCELIPSFLSLFFREKVIFDLNYGFIIGDENKHLLNSINYDKFRQILKSRNCLIDINQMENMDNPDNDMAKKLLEKRRVLREKVNKLKRFGDDDEDLTMADLISIFAEAEHIPLQNVYDLYDVYQFNNQFNRLKIMDDFHVNIQALLAGAKSDEVKLQHWLSKIKQKEN